MIFKVLLLPLFFLITFSSHAGSLTEEQKVFKLLDVIETSGHIFIRNNSEYNSKRARKHLEYKYRYVTKGFWFWTKEKKVTARDFIDKLASQSSTTGKSYFIKTKAGTKVPSRDWLSDKLKEIESSQ